MGEIVKRFLNQIFKKASKGVSTEINKNKYLQNLARSPTIGDFE